MNQLYSLYPNVGLSTTMILTEELIQKYLSDNSFFNDFRAQNHTLLFFNCPKSNDQLHSSLEYRQSLKRMEEKIGKGFFPKRKSYLKFLSKLKQQDPDLFSKLFNNNYRADNVIHYDQFKSDVFVEHRIKNSQKESDFWEIGSCGHNAHYRSYTDSELCMLCDKELINSEVN